MFGGLFLKEEIFDQKKPGTDRKTRRRPGGGKTKKGLVNLWK
jgi:hypothetical protein